MFQVFTDRIRLILGMCVRNNSVSSAMYVCSLYASEVGGSVTNRNTDCSCFNTSNALIIHDNLRKKLPLVANP